MSSRIVNSDRVVIAVDPHKASWTAAAVGPGLQPLATIRVPVSREGYQGLRQFARRWPGAEWAIEGAAGLGAPLITRLSTDGITGNGRARQARHPGPTLSTWGTAARATTPTRSRSEWRR